MQGVLMKKSKARGNGTFGLFFWIDIDVGQKYRILSGFIVQFEEQSRICLYFSVFFVLKYL